MGGLHQTDVLFSVGRVDHGVEPVLLEGDGDLGAVLVQLIDAEVLLHACDVQLLLHAGGVEVLDHEVPAPVVLHRMDTTSWS